jgi:ferritin-like metal-binding protein YciE
MAHEQKRIPLQTAAGAREGNRRGDSVLRLVGNMQTMFHATAVDEVLKGTFASVSLEHYEIAPYKSLIAMAEACNERSVAEVCRQNLREEEAMAHFLDSNIEQVTRSYLAKAASGRESQSGVM